MEQLNVRDIAWMDLLHTDLISILVTIMEYMKLQNGTLIIIVNSVLYIGTFNNSYAIGN